MFFLGFATLAAAVPPPQAGIGMVWGRNDENTILQMPQVRFGQGHFVWKDIEPVEGQFDWSKMDALLEKYHAMGKRVPIQVNSPAPEWIFQHVASTGTARGGKAPQYWDPVYLEKLENFIQAYAQHLGQSPHRDAILYVRMQFLALHTEAVYFGAYLHGTASPDRTKWTFPPNGHVHEPDLTPELEGQMIQKITNLYLDNFTPLNIPVALRLPAEKMLDDRGFNGQAIFDEWCRNPLAWIMTTHYGINIIGAAEGTQWRRRCREMGTIGFMEAFGPISPEVPSNFEEADLRKKMWGVTVPDGPGFKQVNLTPEQAFYWTMLMNLDWGGSYVSVYGQDLMWFREKPSALRAMDFVNLYAGWHTEPQNAPGAWLVMGKFLSRVRESAQGAPRDENDWGFFLKLSPDSKTDPVYLTGPQDEVFGAWARKLTGPAIIDVDPKFAESLKGKTTWLHLVWLEEPGVELQVGQSGEPLVSDGSSTWTDRWIELPGDSLSRIQLVPTKGQPVVHLVEIAREKR